MRELSSLAAVSGSILAVIAAIAALLQTKTRRDKRKWHDFVILAREQYEAFIIKDPRLTAEQEAVENADYGKKSLVVVISDLHLQKDLRNEKAPHESGPIRFLEVARFLFSHKTWELVGEPVKEELREDYLIAKKKCQSPMAVRWAMFCFGFRALVAFFGCVRVACGSGLGKLVPMAVKHWWTFIR